MKTQILLSSLLTLGGSSALVLAAPLGTAFTYQGRLDSSLGPVTGLYDFQFSLWNAPTNPAQGTTLNLNATPVANGFFTVALDFGTNAFVGDARWLEVSVRTNGAAGYATLSPRQPMTPAPYALHTPVAASAVYAERIPKVTPNASGVDISGNAAVSGQLSALGNVGIGTGTPTTRLDVVGNAKVSGVLSAGSASVSGSATVSGQISAGSASVSGTTYLNGQLTAMGNVGVGTSSPSQARLVVSGTSTDFVFNHAAYMPDGAILVATTPPYSLNDVSIKATHAIHANWFRAVSDARIKAIRGRSDGAADLATLATIEIVDYTHKDKLGRGNQPQKKVIGQQVEAVFPQAVSRTTDVVPDIYQRAPIQDGWVTLATDLKVGDRVKLIVEDAEGIHEVLEVGEGKFRTDFKPEDDRIFVYGREVNDFRNVDYEAIAMLNVSATQELARRLEMLAARRTHLAELEQKAARVDALEREVADLRKMVAQLAESSRTSKLGDQTRRLPLPSDDPASVQQVAASLSR